MNDEVTQGVEGEHWLAHLAWTFKDGRANLSPMAMLIDLGDGTLAAKHRSHSVDRAFLAKFVPPAHLDAAVRTESRTAAIQSPYYAEYARRAASSPRGTEQYVRMMDNAISDWSSEPGYWLAAIALLNSRNVAAVEAGPDLTRLNKNRSKRRQEPLLTFSVCRITPRLKSRISQERSIEEGTAGIRAHFVRGHFKARKTGIFWWSPFVRGDKGAGFALKDYWIVGGTQEQPPNAPGNAVSG